MSDFDSAWLKWGWAVVNAQALEDDIVAFAKNVKAPQIRTVSEYDAKRHGIIVSVVDADPTPVRWTLRLGDVINNYRSCLDHIAWALVGRGRLGGNLTAAQERNVYFPISQTRADFNATKGQLPGISRTDFAVLRRGQPYHLGARSARHCWSILAAIGKLDKHRTVQPVWMLPIGAKYKVTNVRDCVVTSYPRHGRTVLLDVNTEIGRFGVRRTGPNPRIQVEYRFRVDPAITQEVALREWLTKSRDHTLTLLNVLAAPPSEIRTLGIIP